MRSHSSDGLCDSHTRKAPNLIKIIGFKGLRGSLKVNILLHEASEPEPEPDRNQPRTGIGQERAEGNLEFLFRTEAAK